MALLFVLIGTIAIVGFALYCMICERAAANEQQRAVEAAPPTEVGAVLTVPRSTAEIRV